MMIAGDDANVFDHHHYHYYYYNYYYFYFLDSILSVSALLRQPANGDRLKYLQGSPWNVGE